MGQTCFLSSLCVNLCLANAEELLNIFPHNVQLARSRAPPCDPRLPRGGRPARPLLVLLLGEAVLSRGRSEDAELALDSGGEAALVAETTETKNMNRTRVTVLLKNVPCTKNHHIFSPIFY